MKKVLLVMLSLPMLLGVMSSCSDTKADAKKLDGKWNIVEVNGSKVEKKERVPFMEFNMADNKLHGNAGCNIFNTTVKLDSKDQSAISFAQPVSTMMACPDMDLEGKVLKNLEEVKAVKAGADANEMKLVSSSGTTLIVLKK